MSQASGASDRARLASPNPRGCASCGDIALRDPRAAALFYAERNLYVLWLHTRYGDLCSCGRPGCARQGKHPRTRRGLHDASTDRATIEAWFAAWPESNVGIACAKSGWLAIDVDPRNGGEEAFARLTAELGPLPTTLTARTGSGGRHYVFSLPTGVQFPKELDRGVDVIASGYIVVEPSVTASVYRWETSLDEPVADVPSAWVARMSREQRSGPATRSRPRAAHESGQPIPEGKRNRTLHRRACAMRRAGFSREAISAAVAAENRACCKPPLLDAEVRSIAKSASDHLPPYFTNGAEFFDDERLTARDRHVLRAIVDHANASGRAFPSLETLAAETALSRSTVQIAVKQLDDVGRIIVKRRPYESNLYQVVAFSPHVVFSPNPQPPTTNPGSYGPIAGLGARSRSESGDA
jgi:Bifunctional DNA primase/polymerase, N-terminal/Primase C terminal 1 (PriCT-1)/Helix-turn-helix domain